MVLLVSVRLVVAGPNDGVRTELERDGHRELIYIDGYSGYSLSFRNHELKTVCGGEYSSFDMCRTVSRLEIGDDGVRTAYDRPRFGDRDRKLATYRIAGLQLDGAFTTFDADGRVHVEGTFRNGMREGPWKEYERDHLRLEAMFVASALDGTATYDFGSFKTTIEFRRGVRHGTYRRVDISGTVVEMTYRNGDSRGPSTEPALGGQSGGSLVRGTKQGVWETRDASGNVVASETYRDGVLDGPSWRLTGNDKQTVSYRAGKRNGWSEIRTAGVVTRRLWENDEVVEVSPRPPSYPWRSAGAEVTAGPMFGKSTAIQAHITLTNVWGTATTSRNGERVGGGYLALGGDLGSEWRLDKMTTGRFVAGVGPVFEAGFGFGDRDPTGRNRGSRVFVQATPSINMTGDVRARVGVGISSPAWTRRALRKMVEVSENSVPEHCSKKSDRDEDCAKLIAMLVAVPVIWATAPIWTINHLELSAEIGSDYHARYGVLVGWGL